ncbi:MAG: YbhB/YbcL family Raf kinase inhibitor-like protein [Alphaproteobacteria bacterium]|nr:YbhB/YbcL family Raf kinase inhibitor-like protein [Alphaproteobacteria bacterium]
MRLAAMLLAVFVAAAGSAHAAMTLTSADVKDGAVVGKAYVHSLCGGENISPQLAWSGAPAGTKSFVLTVIDIDVKPDDFSHWIVVNLPPSTVSLQRGAIGLKAPAKVVANNFGEMAYGGPCPPRGSGQHHYQFTVWALPSPTVSIAPDERARVVRDALTRIAIDKASFTATYGR